MGITCAVLSLSVPVSLPFFDSVIYLFASPISSPSQPPWYIPNIHAPHNSNSGTTNPLLFFQAGSIRRSSPFGTGTLHLLTSHYAAELYKVLKEREKHSAFPPFGTLDSDVLGFIHHFTRHLLRTLGSWTLGGTREHEFSYLQYYHVKQPPHRLLTPPPLETYIVSYMYSEPR